MEPLGWSILLCILMVVAVILEAITPSVGVFTGLALMLAAGSVWFGFLHTPTAGYAMLGVNVLFFPASLYLAIHVLKRSSLMLTKDVQAGVPPEPPDLRPAHELLGQEGLALTTLRPAGTAQFGERRVDVVTEGKFVEAGTKVKVIKVSGPIILVEPVV